MRHNVTSQEVIIKRFSNKEAYSTEKHCYLFHSRFAPKLISHNDYTNTLVIEKCTPILEVENNIVYKDKLWKLLEELHKDGRNHRDVSLINVVIKDGEPLLIDWEASAPSNPAMKSYDLYGAIESGITIPDEWIELYGENGIWWGGPWDNCPGKYWSENV